MALFNVTYEIVTPESAEEGEAESLGFIAQDVSLREAVGLVGGCAAEADSWPVNASIRWLTNYEYGHDFRTSARESRSLHISDNVTGASRLRIARLLGVRVQTSRKG